MPDVLTALDWDEDDCPVCGGTGFVPVLVHGLYMQGTEKRPCSAPIHRMNKED